jgi:DNA-binding CsgD family transcriptional regulator
MRICTSFVQTARTQFFMGLTFCFYLVWTLLCCVGPELAVPEGSPLAQVGSVPSWLGPLFCIVVTSGVVAAYYRRTRRIPESSQRLVVLAGALVATTFFHVLWSLDTRAENWLPYVLASLFFGGAGTFLRIEMNRLLGWVGTQQTIYLGIIGMFLSTLVFALLARLPGPCLYAATFLSGVLAIVFLWLSIRDISRSRYYRRNTEIKLHFPLKFVCTSVVQGCAVGIMYLGVSLAGMGAVGDVRHLAANVSAAVLLFACIMFMRLDFNRLVYKVGFPVLALGFVLLTFLQDNVAIGFSVILLGFCYLDLVLWSLGSCLIKSMGLPAPWIATCLGAALYSGMLIGSLMVISMKAVAFPPGILYGWGSLFACFLLMTALFLSNSNNLKYGWGTVRPGDEGLVTGDLDTVVQFLAKEHSLTNREAEILLLLAKGKTRRAMCEELCVSADTIKTHVKNVYRKLSVHSQQQTIDYIDFVKEKFEAGSETS